jgi:hypothetical protein
LFVGVKGWDELPARLEGNFVAWISKADKRVKVNYPKEAKDDGIIPEDVFMLHKLLAHGFRYEMGEKNRPRPVRDVRAMLRAAPQAQGAGDAAGAAGAAEDGDESEDDDDRRFVDIRYEEGAATKEQRWYFEKPDAIKKDAGPVARAASLNRLPSAIDTPWKAVVNAAMPPRLVEGLLRFMNERLDDSDHDNRKTTYGEVLAFLSALLALCLIRGVPLAEWSAGPSTRSRATCSRRYGLAGMASARTAWKSCDD